MLRVDCFYFYKLGVVLRPLEDVSENQKLIDVWLHLYTAKTDLDSFFVSFPLKTSLKPASALYRTLQKIIPDDWSQINFKREDGEPRLISFTEATEIRDSLKEFESVLKAELSGWDTFFVSQKGAFSTSDLIDRAEIMLPESAHKYLSDEAKEDVRQAGRCLAFNLGTAAGFHIVRAAESFIWKYYEAIVGTLPAVKVRNWGAYAKNLSKVSGSDPKVIGWMNQIKDEYRNPVLHPDEKISPDDALEFINACTSLMTAIARALNKLP